MTNSDSPRAPRRTFFRPRVEPLEGRCVPTVFTVTSNLMNLTVDGQVTLQEALQAANTNAPAGDAPAGSPTAVAVDVIRFAPSLTSAPTVITLTGAQLVITEDVTINGPGLANFPNGLIALDAKNLSRIFLVDDSAATAINVTLNGLIFFQGSASGEDGGAIFSRENLTVRNSFFSTNKSTTAGGAVGSTGRLTVENSTFTNNSAPSGGAIANAGGTLMLRDSSLTGNTATSDDGGALHNAGPATIERSNISGNTATSLGGGIFNSPQGTLVIGNSSISSNHAGVNGGGIFLRGDDVATMSISDSTFNGNTAGNGAGGISIDHGTVAVERSTVSGNTGGGISTNEGSLAVSDSTIANNTGGEGGGFDLNGNATIKNSTISGNGGTKGGGIYNNRQLTLISCTVSGNTSSGNGGGVFTEVFGGFTTAISTIIAGNDAAGSGDDVSSDAGHFQAAFSLIESTAGALITPVLFPTRPGLVVSNLFGVDPLLGPLADNGGPTLTHALLPGSPALDRGFSPDPSFGDPTLVLVNDQRGFGYERVIGAAADVGAYESRDADVRLVPDPLNRGRNVLVVIGTRKSDVISLRRDGADVEVTLNGVFHAFDARAVHRVAAFGMEGNDRITSALAVGALLDGGRGADVLTGGNGDDVLVGGDGNDVLVGGNGADVLSGGAGRDVLIGGNGVDRLAGGAGDDLLIGGRTVYDQNQRDLTLILAEWSSPRTYAQRRANLLAGRRVPRLARPQVTDRSADVLTGDDGLELFYRGAGDQLQARVAAESVVSVS